MKILPTTTVTKRRLKLTITTTRRTRMPHPRTGEDPEAVSYEPSPTKNVRSLPAAADETSATIIEAGSTYTKKI